MEVLHLGRSTRALRVRDDETRGSAESLEQKDNNNNYKWGSYDSQEGSYSYISSHRSNNGLGSGSAPHDESSTLFSLEVSNHIHWWLT